MPITAAANNDFLMFHPPEISMMGECEARAFVPSGIERRKGTFLRRQPRKGISSLLVSTNGKRMQLATASMPT
jgi:hypothetical protein